MSLQTMLLATLIVSFGAVQYTLMTHAIRDLLHRPRVRGGNKVSWGLAILCLPIAGALIYGWMGPTSFIRRATIDSSGDADADTSSVPLPSLRTRTPVHSGSSRSLPAPRRNVTPIRSARSARLSSPSGVRPSDASPRVRRTGS